MVPLTLVAIMTEFYYEGLVTHMVNLRMDYSSDGHSCIVPVLQNMLGHNQQEVKRRVEQSSHSAVLSPCDGCCRDRDISSFVLRKSTWLCFCPAWTLRQLVRLLIRD